MSIFKKSTIELKGPEMEEKKQDVMMEPTWMAIARKEIGVKEASGSKDNPRIVEYHRTCTRGSKVQDSIPWCSSFVNWVMKEAGYLATGSRAARSWLTWGVGMGKPSIGAIVVLWRGSPDADTGHVGFVSAVKADKILVLGGNQNNEVNETWYPRSRVLGYRWVKPDTRNLPLA